MKENMSIKINANLKKRKKTNTEHIEALALLYDKNKKLNKLGMNLRVLDTYKQKTKVKRPHRLKPVKKV